MTGGSGPQMISWLRWISSCSVAFGDLRHLLQFLQMPIFVMVIGKTLLWQREHSMRSRDGGVWGCAAAAFLDGAGAGADEEVCIDD